MDSPLIGVITTVSNKTPASSLVFFASSSLAKFIIPSDEAKSIAIFSIDSIDIPVRLLVFSKVKLDKFVKVSGTDFLLSLLDFTLFYPVKH